jgi:quercetin dioxygenase-like cupin family protein
MQNKIEILSSEVTILGTAEGRAFDLLGARFLIKARCEKTDGAFCILQMEIPPAAGVPLHHHPYAEIFHVLSGRPEFSRIQNGSEQRLATEAGETIVVPANAPHGLFNWDSTPARLLVIATSRHQSFFAAAGVAADPSQPPTPATEAELQRVVRIASQHTMFVD